jgi:hypothetical protein
MEGGGGRCIEEMKGWLDGRSMLKDQESREGFVHRIPSSTSSFTSVQERGGPKIRKTQLSANKHGFFRARKDSPWSRSFGC